jgi:hypothetical protein
LLSISKKDRIASRQLQKKSGAGAEGSKKRAGLLLRIKKKTGPAPTPQRPGPRIIIILSGGAWPGPALFRKKSPVTVLAITKKEPIGCQEFQKRSHRELRIPEKVRIGC